MKFAIQVNEGPYQHQASDTAFQFAKAAIAKGHEIMRVFFYHDGVNNASRFTVPPQDDRNVVNNWADLKNADGSDIDKVVCVAAALRRGMLDTDEAGKNGIDGNNIHPAFRISGLGQLIEAGIQADRLVVFGD
jgi:tRNA 2-thiouridine synthesizing protein D